MLKETLIFAVQKRKYGPSYDTSGACHSVPHIWESAW